MRNEGPMGMNQKDAEQAAEEAAKESAEWEKVIEDLGQIVPPPVPNSKK